MKKPTKKKTVRRREEIAALIDEKNSRKFVRDAENALIDTEEKVETDHAYAHGIFLLQDEATRKAIWMMQEKMLQMAGEPIFRFRGIVWNAEKPRLRELQEKLLFHAAVRLFVACAMWDIQIANFKLPDDSCAKCGKPTRS